MDKNLQESSKEIQIPVWWSSGGGMSYRRDALPIDHPEHPYNYIKDKLKLIPEDYGIFHPDIEEYKDYTKEELLIECAKLKSELRNLYKNL